VGGPVQDGRNFSIVSGSDDAWANPVVESRPK
jgi:hypothetical protein